MNIKKELSSISWNVTEPEYRADPALSYSTLARYEREGYDGLDHLFDKVESPSLLQGSMLDTIITGSMEEFNEQYYVADFPSVGDKELSIANFLFDTYKDTYNKVSKIPYSNILAAANTYEFQKNWRDDTRVKVLIERCEEYYSLKYKAEGKTIVEHKVYEKVIAMAEALRNAPATKGYFAEDNPDSPIRRYFQLKFKATFEGVNYRCMADELVVDYDKQVVYPIDLKTSGHPEWHFEDSFITWKYFIQSRLYWRIIRQNMNADKYFRNFELKNYRFVVVNKNTLTPLVWEFPHTCSYMELFDENDNKYRDPFEIGKELSYYLNNRPSVPKGINVNGINTIKCLHVKDYLMDL